MELLPPSNCSDHKQIHEIVHTAIPIGDHVPMCCVNMWVCLKHRVSLSVCVHCRHMQKAHKEEWQHLPLWGKMSQIHQWCCPARARWSDSPHWGMRALHTLHRRTHFSYSNWVTKFKHFWLTGASQASQKHEYANRPISTLIYKSGITL